MAEQPQTITEAAAWIRSGRVSSVELTETLLARCHAAQDTVAAFITICDDAALEAARRADAEFSRGIDRGPLQGVPMAVKDIIATADAPTTANSRVLDRRWGDRADATVVRKLREAGAVLMGKLALWEFAFGPPDPEACAEAGFPIPKNPWDLSRSPGGSSSGTAAAIAAGLILGGLGTDTGGSIRGPAAYCGISGLKPTFGRVSKDGCVPNAHNADVIGPMARTARDCALMLEVMAGFDPADPCTVDVPVSPMAAGMDGSFANVRIGLPRHHFFTAPELDAEVKAVVLAAVDQMAAAGATVVEVQIPHAAEARLASRVMNLSESYAYHEPNLRRCPELYGKYTRLGFLPGAFLTAADYLRAQRFRSLARAECAQALADVDVLITPVRLGTAPTFEGWETMMSLFAMPSFTSIWNLTGFPALSVGCGFSGAGLPIGMQIVGRPFDEATVLRIGDAYQQITDWHTRVPERAREIQQV